MFFSFWSVLLLLLLLLTLWVLWPSHLSCGRRTSYSTGPKHRTLSLCLGDASRSASTEDAAESLGKNLFGDVTAKQLQKSKMNKLRTCPLHMYIGVGVLSSSSSAFSPSRLLASKCRTPRMNAVCIPTTHDPPGRLSPRIYTACSVF